MSLTGDKILAIKKLDEALSDTCFSKNEAFEILKNLGYEPNKVVNDHLQKIKKLQIQAEIENSKAKRTRLDLLNIAKKKLKEIKEKTSLNLVDSLNQLFPKNVEFQFRKLEDLSDDDKLEMLEESQLLKLIKELENNNG